MQKQAPIKQQIKNCSHAVWLENMGPNCDEYWEDVEIILTSAVEQIIKTWLEQKRQEVTDNLTLHHKEVAQQVLDELLTDLTVLPQINKSKPTEVEP
jgi:hypothetical protein